jgi:hypothetical protein
VRLHFVRDLIIQRLIKVLPIATNDQLADIFTKGLNSLKFETLCKELMVN